MAHDRSLLVFDPTFPPCTDLPREERFAEKRRRQALVSEARCKGFGPTGRPEQWRSECWPAEDSAESILAWVRWALDHLTHTLLPELEVPSAYRSDALLLVHHLAACRSLYAPEDLPEGDDIASVRALLEKLARWLEGVAHPESPHQDARLAGLAEFARTRLRAKQRRAIDLLIEHGGSLSLASLATDEDIGWLPPYDDAFSSLQSRLNEKLDDAGLPYRIVRHDGEVRIDVKTT